MSNIDDSDSHASSFDEADDQDWADWVDDDQGQQEYTINGHTGLQTGEGSSNGMNRTVYNALFLDQTSTQLQAFKTPKEALDHSAKLGCDIPELVKRLDLDALQVIRLFNYLRRQSIKGDKIDPKQINQLNGKEEFLNDDDELKPVKGFENDGLLQLDFDDLDAELGGAEASGTGNSITPSDKQKVATLESQVQVAQLTIQDLRQRLAQNIGLDNLEDVSSDEEEARKNAQKAIMKGKAGTSAISGEDSYYFSSYASHDIHQTMIADKVRTLSYAKFILAPENAHLFRGKVVMDVGCGSGILSMFAARAGAKEVIAIDASAVASRAKENIRINRLDGIINVYHGRVEALDEVLQEYKGSVDVIVSEWMGYFLLYESMMPAVLYARDRYLRKQTGLLAPSHTRMLLSAVADCEIIQERFGFWDDVYGFSMNAMKTGLADEAWTDYLKAEQVVTSVDTLLELPLHTIAPHQPSFSAPFALRVKRDCTIQAFISWFDTWFTPDGKPVPQQENDSEDDESSEWDGQIEAGKTLEGLPPVTIECPQEGEVRGLDLKRDNIVAKNTDKTDGKGLTVSFTTSPFGPETHWKQTLFVLKEPIEAKKDCVLVGLLRSTPNEENTRELDVEIHYSLREPTQPAQARRKSVEARTVQLFSVR
jgi:type I protein arginine methyltransferase